MANSSDTSNAPTGTVASILTALSHTPTEVMRQFLDVVVRGVGTVYEPIDIILTAKAKRIAAQQEAKAIVEREEILGEIAGKADMRLINVLLDDLRTLPPAERLKFSESLLESQKLAKVINRERRLQDNRLNIVRKAVAYLPQEPDFARVEQDWIDAFFRYSEIVTDDDLQEVWAQILAGKIKDTKSYAKKTMRALQDLTKREAELFVRLCSVVFDVDGELMTIRLDNDTDRYLQFADLKYDDLLILDEYGLVTLGARSYKVDLGSIFTYFDEKFEVVWKFQYRANPLTRVGRELLQIVVRDKNEAYLHAVQQLFGANIRRL